MDHRVLLGIGLCVVAAVASMPGAAAAPIQDGFACEPVVLGYTIDWTTTPPTVTPNVWIRPECL